MEEMSHVGIAELGNSESVIVLDVQFDDFRIGMTELLKPPENRNIIHSFPRIFRHLQFRIEQF